MSIVTTTDATFEETIQKDLVLVDFGPHGADRAR